MNYLILLILFLEPKIALAQQFSIEGFLVRGDGCDPNSVAIDISPDKKSFTMSFSNFLAEVRASAGPENVKKVCNTVLKVNSEPGWSFSIARFDIRGFAMVEAGAIVRQRAAFAFDGVLADIDSLRIAGPFNDNFIMSTDLTLSNRNPWSPCERRNHRLSIRTGLVVKAKPGSGGFIAADSIDGELTQTYGLLWRQCTPNPNGGGRRLR
jgi:hypothetical protein